MDDFLRFTYSIDRRRVYSVPHEFNSGKYQVSKYKEIYQIIKSKIIVDNINNYGRWCFS